MLTGAPTATGIFSCTTVTGSWEYTSMLAAICIVFGLISSELPPRPVPIKPSAAVLAY